MRSTHKPKLYGKLIRINLPTRTKLRKKHVNYFVKSANSKMHIEQTQTASVQNLHKTVMD